MDFKLFPKDYIVYIKNAYNRINSAKDYITELDSVTGDGDHWVNINMGFEKLMEISNELETLSFEDMFKKIGMTLMSGIGGSSGVLYGGAYIAAAKVVHSKEFIDLQLLNDIFKAEIDSIMNRGKCKPGDKTMLDSLYAAYTTLNDNINNSDIIDTLNNVKKQAIIGAENTKDMEAVKGRASYQTNKGVGHLDPGAVTMSYQIEELINVILASIK